jgi:hypothetical protein
LQTRCLIGSTDGEWNGNDTNGYSGDEDGSPPGCAGIDVDVLEKPLADGSRSPAKRETGIVKEANVRVGVGWSERGEMVVEGCGVPKIGRERLEEVFCRF